MKSKIAIFSTLVCMLGIYSVHASGCKGDGCLRNYETIQKPAPLSEEINSSSAQTLPPVWTGSQEKFNSPGFDKTVDWRDGMPIWDDSVSSYTEKDFRDWPMYGSQGFDYENTDQYETITQFADKPDITITENEIGDGMYETSFGIKIDAIETDDTNKLISTIYDTVEELLIPIRPQLNMWANFPEQDLSNAVKRAFGESKGCPFETESECAIWQKKPMVRETVSPRSPKIRAEMMARFITAARHNNKITANDPAAAPLLNRYKMLMRSATACCTDGMTYELREAGASDGLIYKFLSDDANFYGIGNRCLMMSDTDFDKKYTNTATAAVAADVRNGCLCRGRQWFKAMLAPFVEAYETAPEFVNEKFNYKYTDGLKREITVSVNTDVQNVLKQLTLCP